MDAWPLWVGRIAVTAFFAIAFVQSAVDKIQDSRGNLSYLTGHFANSPLRGVVPPLFWILTFLEALAGVCCSLGALVLLCSGGTWLALRGLECTLLSLGCLFFGQRLAKDYGGSVVIASYYAVALVGLLLFGARPQ